MARRLPYLGLEHVESGTGRITRDASTTSMDDGMSATFRFDERHILYGKLRPYLNKVALPAFEGRCTTEIMPLRPTDVIDREYLAFILRSERVVAAATRFSTGSRMPRADLDQLLTLEIEIPNLDVQRACVKQVREIVDAAETAITLTKILLKDSSLLTRAYLREQFGKSVPIFIGRMGNSPQGWRSHKLPDLARLESGHTPSRRHPEWWGGNVPWLALPDIRKLHGKNAYETTEYTNDAGLRNSSARLLPVSTVCLCRDASVGFVTILGRPMATSQHFANWVCDPEKLDAEFLLYAFMASYDYLHSLGSGSVIKTIYMPTIKSLHVCAPDIAEQRRIARALRERLAAAESLTTGLETRLAEIERLPQRLLTAVFGQAG